MAKRQREWARRKRDWLFSQLGQACRKCGSTKNLEFDVIIPVGNNDHHRRKDWSARMSFYTRQHEQHNLQVLCEKCNSSKQDKMDLLTLQPPEQPF